MAAHVQSLALSLEYMFYVILVGQRSILLQFG